MKRASCSSAACSPAMPKTCRPCSRVARSTACAMRPACTTITKVEGEQLVHEKLALKVAGAWNKVAPPGSRQPYDVWTQEGIFLDELRFWAAVKPGEAMVVPPPVRAQDQKAPRV